MRISLTTLTTLVITPGLLGFCPVELARTEELIRFSAVHTVTIDEAHAVEVGDTPDHVLRLIRSSGTNKSTGTTTFLDGATETEVVYGDDDKGSGQHHGYIFYTASDGTLVNEFDGYGITVMVDGKPRFVGGGSWHTIRGTGQYLGAVGIGTYRAEMGKTEWDGTFVKR
jgi:hypothetical protein